MNFYYLVIILSLIGVFSKQKAIDIKFFFKILSIGVVVNLWEFELISDSQAYISFVLLYSIFIFIQIVSREMVNSLDEEVDRI